MTKYIDAEKLKESLKRRDTDITVPVITSEGGLESYYRRREIRDIIKLIDSLQQEQPEVNFKIEERKWVHDAVDNIFPEDGDFMSEVDFRKILKDTAHHFYELGKKDMKEQMMKEAVEGYVTLTLTGALTVAATIKEGDNIGISDKVRIIIVKEEG